MDDKRFFFCIDLAIVHYSDVRRRIIAHTKESEAADAIVQPNEKTFLIGYFKIRNESKWIKANHDIELKVQEPSKSFSTPDSVIHHGP